MNDKKARHYKRRNFLVKKDFQGRFILLFLSVAILGGILSMAGFVFFSVKKIEYLIYSVHIPRGRLNEIILKEMLYSNLFALLFVVLAFLVTIRWMTKRIAGPLKRIKKDLEAIRDGDLSFDITLRFKDEFKDFASEVNHLVEALRRRFASLRRHTERIDGHLRGIERSSQRIDQVKLRASEIIEEVEEMEKVLGKFKT